MLRLKSIFSSITKFRSLPIMGVFILLMAAFTAASPEVFTKPMIYLSFLSTIPPELIMALGLTLVITAGEIDLSFGSIIALSGYILCYFIKAWNMPWLGLICALGAGALIGYINGLLVAKLGVPSIMATLASQFFWFGMTVLLCGGLFVNIKEVKGHLLHSALVGRIFIDLNAIRIGDYLHVIKVGDYYNGIPLQFFWSLGLAIFLWFILNRHKFGEAILFIGDNPNVARVMGINVERTKIILFTINGTIAGFAAVIYTLEMIQFYTIQGAGSIMPVMAAVFIGGTSIAGGEGFIFGTFFGMYIIGSLEAGVVATGISQFFPTKIITGLVMAGSVILNVVLEKLRTRQKGFKKILGESVFLKKNK